MMDVLKLGLNVPKVNYFKIGMRRSGKHKWGPVRKGQRMKTTNTEFIVAPRAALNVPRTLLTLRKPSFWRRCAVDHYYSLKGNSGLCSTH